jgi:alkylation response protein AidB-like acyl-CoA dehydrogenase
LAGSSDRHRDLLEQALRGDRIVVLAHEETAHYPTSSLQTTATPNDAGYLLNGTKRYVPFGCEADQLIVSALLDGQPSLFIVDAQVAARQAVRLIDIQARATITLTDVQVGADDLVCQPGDADPVLASAMTRGTALLAAELVGAAEAAFELTIEHLRRREQFDAIIGSFQALQHRAARAYLELELAISLVVEALRLCDASADDTTEAVSSAKAFASDTFLLIASEGVQLHGGLGMTDEADIGLYLKRARVGAEELGSAAHHRRVVSGQRLTT